MNCIMECNLLKSSGNLELPQTAQLSHSFWPHYLLAVPQTAISKANSQLRAFALLSPALLFPDHYFLLEVPAHLLRVSIPSLTS